MSIALDKYIMDQLRFRIAVTFILSDKGLSSSLEKPNNRPLYPILSINLL